MARHLEKPWTIGAPSSCPPTPASTPRGAPAVVQGYQSPRILRSGTEEHEKLNKGGKLFGLSPELGTKRPLIVLFSVEGSQWVQMELLLCLFVTRCLAPSGRRGHLLKAWSFSAAVVQCWPGTSCGAVG